MISTYIESVALLSLAILETGCLIAICMFLAIALFVGIRTIKEKL